MSIRLIILLTILSISNLSAEVVYEKFFIDKALRYDFILAGNANEAKVYPEQIKKEKYWAGSKVNLIDRFDYGTYRFRVIDQKTNKLIFLKGFSPIFVEWQTTDEAKEIEKSFYQSVIFPFPKNKVKLFIEKRKFKGGFELIHSVIIDPDDYFIIEENEVAYKHEILKYSGDPENKVDLVFLAEGYTNKQMDKFLDDANRMMAYLFKSEPFKKYKGTFNVYAILSPSVDSGTDVPGENIYKNTVFNSSFYTFNTPRYLTTTDMKSVYDAAAVVPYDHIYILVNTDRYGGGGFYNFLGIGSVDDGLAEHVFVHEFGHSFAGLGDEYYTSDVAYEEFYNRDVEPWEPNLTTLVNFKSKWKNMLSINTPVPTPRIAKNDKTIGVYEGGGYSANGIYSPYMNCRMKSNSVDYFCPVCTKAIEQVINWQSE